MIKLKDSSLSRGKLKFTKKNILIALTIITLLVISPFKYNDYRKKSLKKEVEVYLKQLGYEDKAIDKLEPFHSFKGYGDTKYMVEVELKGDKGG